MVINIIEEIEDVMEKLKVENPLKLEIQGNRNFEGKHIYKLYELINKVNENIFIGEIVLKTHLEDGFLEDWPLCKDIVSSIDSLIIINDKGDRNEKILKMLVDYFPEKVTIRAYVSTKDISTKCDLDFFMGKMERVGANKIELKETKNKKNFISFKKIHKHPGLKNTLLKDQTDEILINTIRVSVTRYCQSKILKFLAI